ncbi:MAG: type II toxin-antitoxin system VapC family toxin [Burkholderiaceae bacterium]|jgi:tRNA(fMet)-specific endonuclease VapC|nr:type II toxin-antitoxin system VapC family toxin [Burkholderiaceae bacterium]
MQRYFLDTNICIYALHRGMPGVLQILLSKQRSELVISTLVVAELATGVMGSQRVQANRSALQAFLVEMTVEPWPEAAAWHYARESRRLKALGRPIGMIDLLLGCQALAEDGIIVTRNVREFERIEGLRIEDWTQAG